MQIWMWSSTIWSQWMQCWIDSWNAQGKRVDDKPQDIEFEIKYIYARSLSSTHMLFVCAFAAEIIAWSCRLFLLLFPVSSERKEIIRLSLEKGKFLALHFSLSVEHASPAIEFTCRVPCHTISLVPSWFILWIFQPVTLVCGNDLSNKIPLW